MCLPTERALHLDYLNADGGSAALCVNGTRCAARLAEHLGWAAGVCRIRKTDELHDLCRIINEAVDTMKAEGTTEESTTTARESGQATTSKAAASADRRRSTASRAASSIVPSR